MAQVSFFPQLGLPLGRSSFARLLSLGVLTAFVRRRRERLGNQCVVEVNHLQAGHDLRYHLRDAGSHHRRRPDSRHHQERNHPQRGLPGKCRSPDARLHMRTRRCLFMGHVVHKTLGPRLLHILSHLSRRWCRCRYCRSFRGPVGMEQGQGLGCYLRRSRYGPGHLCRLRCHYLHAH